ncbi:MAG: energy transducer TonB [Candidatus Baltobacteraceae bacterium]
MQRSITFALAVILLGSAHIQKFAATPQEAAVRAMEPSSRPQIVRVNIAGPYATVFTRGGLMEGSPVALPILVKHFSFGWQALELLNSSCNLDERVLGASAKAALMRGLPAPSQDSNCGMPRDDGDAATIVAIRRQMFGRALVPSVIVHGDFALASWYGAGGGETLFKKMASTNWLSVAGGGGAMGAQEMRKYGVPQDAWHAFGIADPAADACAKPSKDVTLVQAATPDYPHSARALHLGAVDVIISVTIDAKAEVIGSSVVQSSGNADLDRAALVAARQSTYSPKIVNCSPVTGTYMFRVNFNPSS